MIIDDQEEVRSAIKNLVQSYGFEARTFASAEEFLESSLDEQTTYLMSGVELQTVLLNQGRRIIHPFLKATDSS